MEPNLWKKLQKKSGKRQNIYLKNREYIYVKEVLGMRDPETSFLKIYVSDFKVHFMKTNEHLYI